MRLKRNQCGLSMVELLVALALSSFLILGVTQIYIDNKRNYLFQQGQSETQENARFVALVFEQQLSKAGYRRKPDESIEQAFPAEPTPIQANINGSTKSCSFNAGEAIRRIDNQTFCIRYQPKTEREQDCTGEAIQGESGDTLARPYSSAKRRVVEFVSVSNGSLICATSQRSVPLIHDGIESMHLQYGVGPNSDKVIERITSNSTEITDNVIRGVSYALLLRSSSTNLREGIETNTLCKWRDITGQAKAGCEQVGDNRLYQIATGAVTIRNLMP